ncbi:uncharacterized protein LOC124542928 [Vanessa cardui]|uniref:uncharacterized protein LOC124542928 n=1 Tax=Vanessa cardui TaxID=171605 RepID=UPI001F1371A1|nr:uncharacterized protein LOC124542928 [Vanessa cardui]XP_046976829.1 uncharacterized protein LOC124542928 [Vanessa cardui]
MSTGEDEPSSGLNGRLRPRKSTIPSPLTTTNIRKLDSKSAQDKPKKSSTPSKVSPNKLDDLTDKSDSPAPQILCTYCDKSFFSKQAVSKHIRRIHILSSKQDNVINCLFCNHTEADSNDIIRHMVDNHPNQYFACYDCHTRFPSTTELAEHKLNVCENPKLPYRNKLRQKTTPKKSQKARSINDREFENDDKNYTGHAFNGIVISCELKPSHPHDPIDIEDNITTNLILPPGKSLGSVNVIEKNAIIVLDDLQWNKRIPPNFSFHNTDADQILSRLGVVHRSPRTGENNRKDWLKHIDDSNQKFEKCFDTSFYSKVASNVQENLAKFLDGSFNFNPDPENTIKTRKAKNSVAINTVEGFPILLASDQFSRNVFDGYMPRSIAPKHKWKWDNLESDKNLMSPEQIKRDSHTNNCIITLVSSLDIWTQLCMRRKFEEKFTTPLEKRIEKQSIIGNELKEILESRELPTSSSQVVNYTGPTLQTSDSSDFPASLGLVPNAPNFDLKPAVLSGEWVRPRCYVCCACGAQTRDSRALSSHISTQHPNAQIQHYEIVGEVLLNSDILKHLYVPPSQLNNRTRPLRGFRECTKCRKGVSLEDLHQHMLDCAGDTPTVRRKCRYRPFGVRKRRPRLPDNTIRQEMRKDIRHSRHNRKTHMRPRPKIRTEVGDAETIRKMLADLPAKRHRAIVNPLNPILRPRRKLNKQRSKMVIKKRAIDEMLKKPKSNDLPQTSNSTNEDRQKSTSNLKKPENKALQLTTHSAKRASSGILSHKSSLIKKNTISKNRKKVFATKDMESGGTDGTDGSCGTRENDGTGGTEGDDDADGNDGTDGNEGKNGSSGDDGLKECSDLPLQPLENEDNVQINQMSTSNNSSERININDGSSSSREHGNRSSGSNNKDGQIPGCSGQNSNSRDSFAPSQNVPLKHSIARLTASSETHDKSVQFHHLFLVQQECNNVNQHLPSGQRMLFENEAVVTKLDKPPLHFNHSEVLDAQSFQRNKLNKPRKGLNDCIAMLRNKLVEPNSNILPGHVSVQCGSDEPLGPEPVVIERRRSTTDSNIETAQRSMQMFYPNRSVEDTSLSYDTSSRVTRRSSTRHGHSSRREKIIDVQPNNDFMYWNQFYYNKQILPTNKSSQRFNKRESTRRRSVVSTEELLLQHAMNLEMLSKSNRNLKNLPDYQYPNVPTNIQITHKTSRKSRQEGPKTRSTSNNSMTKPKNKATTRTRQKKITDINSSQGNTHQKISDVDAPPNTKTNERNFDHSTVINNMTSTNEKTDHYYVQERIEDKTTELGVEKPILHASDMPEEQLCSNMCSNVPMMQYANDYDVAPVHYNIDSTSTAPLDLSNKTTSLEDTRHYITEEVIYCEGNYDSYETLDLSNKSINIVEPEKDLCNNNDEVVDLRVNNSSQLLPSHSTTTALSERSNNLEGNATDFSYGHPERWIYEPDDCLPTDLSMRRNDLLTDTYEKRRLYTHDSSVEINIIEDLSHPTTHVRDMCMVAPQREDLDTEEPTDLSIRRIGSRSNISSVCISQEQHISNRTHSNSINKQSGPNDEEIPADLSSTNKDTIHNNYYLDEQRIPQYLEAVVSNNHEIRPVIDGIAPQAHLSSIDSGQIIGAHYNLTAQVPIQAAALEPRTIITYSEPLLNETQNMTTAGLVSTPSGPCDLPISINCPSIKECGNRNDVTYLISDEPLSLSTKKSGETKICSLMHRELVPSRYEYENAKEACTLSQYKEAEPSSTNTNSNLSLTSKAFSPVRPVNETTVVRKSSSPPLGHKAININNRKLSSENDLSKEKSPASTYRIDMDNCNMETLKENYNKTNLDQDPETAKKIAMLPKELVEILGTMPADHRIQLLNVLPQYVSSSTSPVSSQNTGSVRRNSTCVSANSSSPSLISNHSESDLKSSESLSLLPNQTTSSQILQFVETSPTVSSSILLTPPTPQLSDRHSNQTHENSEIKSIEYRRKSRISIDEQTPQNIMISDNLKASSYPTTLDEYNRQDRIIDLTGDEFSPDTPDVSYNMEPYANLTRTSKDIPSSIAAPKSKALKTNSDKTASLRAVRIKTSSERQRTVLTENTLAKKHVDSTSHLAEEELQNKSSEITMAIQQDEISSTQHRPAIRTSPTVHVRSDLCPNERILNDKQMPVDKVTDENKDYDVNYSLPEKQNIVTSSLSKDTHSNFKDDIITKDNMHHANTDKSSKLPVSLNAIDVRFSKNIEQDYCSHSKIGDGLLKDKVVTKTEFFISPGSKKAFTVDDDDSEDDVTLAVIVKQKRRSLHASRDDETLKEKINTTKEIGSLNKSSDQKNQMSFNKTSSSEIGSLCETQLLKSSSDTSYNTKKIKSDENQTKLSELSTRKKGRKGRRVNIIESTNYVLHQGPTLNTKAESEDEINKENNMYIESIENTEVSNNSVNSEQVEPDNNRSTPINIENEKEIVPNTTARKEKAEVTHSSYSDSLTSENVIKEKSNFEANIRSQKDVTEDSNECKLMRLPHTTAEDDIEAIEREKLSSKDVVSSEEVKIDETRVIDLKNQANIIKIVESKNICPSIATVENSLENKNETEIDEINLTPLRRSRRGKSLFIDSRSILNDNSLNADNNAEPRAPLTKKQLIFSKLLQDEENHKKPVLTTSADKPISESISKAINENKVDNNRDSEFNNYETDEIKCNKRKKSPQSKKKLKKKKSITNVQITNEQPEEQVADEKIQCLEQNRTEKTPDSKVSSILVTSQIDDTKIISTNPTDSTGNLEIPSTVITKKVIEKRKSNSPNRDEMLPILKLKKPKLNDEVTVVSHTERKEDIKITETEIKLKENIDSLPTIVATRNTTCYNKAIRRARSKSVCVKSSGTELYDPYDIDKIEDLEDVIDKSESFVRIDVSSVQFNTSKAVVAIKTRKLSKTAPSAIIDILPSEAKPPVDDVSDDNLDKRNTSEYNNNSNVDTKDGSSDSDASSKSDVPLKIYVQEKEKKLMEISPTSERLEKSLNNEENSKTDEKSKSRKKYKQTQSINNNDLKNNINKTQNEEELRSEQFMESFGFFSERKPRKSNLLATKKISETYNLIENDEIYYASKDRVTKKSANDSNKEDQALSLRKSKCTVSPPKKATKRGRKKKTTIIIQPSFCTVCKKFFRRWDNYVRHLLSLYHISRLCEIELKVKTVLIEEEPNYLLAYRQQLNRLKVLQNKIAKRKKNCLSTADIVLPTLEEILADVKRTIREQQLSRRSLSRDEALFIDCCEMLKESHQNQGTPVKRVRQCNSFNCEQACQEELALLEKSILDDRCAIKSDEEMDSVTAKKILESEEVRNLENDLISNLKEANGLKGPLTSNQLESPEKLTTITDSQTILSTYEITEESNRSNYKPHIEVKDKLYPDVVENIDMFEDKFDKIKRKCRSQAAAAKQVQTHVELNASYKNRKKSEKKKVNNRKGQNTVPTKGALKGFDGVKVSIQTSDINMSAIVPIEKVHRKKRKSGSKKKRERTNSEKSSYRESNNSTKDLSQKKVDVYEFMDTEDTEVFEFRPSTLMERLKSINNKELPSTSKTIHETELAEVSSESGSDGDDFVYMSDDYVCSDDETENSMLSCELGNGKGNIEHKISTLVKRKEATEKNAVMGKIFKNNAVRTERKSPKSVETVKPKANLDQLFDSLLENEPKTSQDANDEVSSDKDEGPPSRVYLSISPQKEDQSRFNKSLKRSDQALTLTSETGLTQKYSTPSPTLHPSLASFSTRRKSITPPRKLEPNINPVSISDQVLSKRNDDHKKIESPIEIHSKKYEPLQSSNKNLTAPDTDDALRRQSDEFDYEEPKSKDLFYQDKSDKKKRETPKYDSYDYDVDSYDHILSEDAGVARQRARRKCTVGKQNVLAETWSSESEPDGAPPRPNSAESVAAGSGRKKKSRKRDSQSSSNRKASRLVSTKKHEYESRVDSSNRSAGSGLPARPRSPPHYWSEGDDEQGHPQQHGWIVGDSHKKLVTMLAHAKGRKRSGDDKRHLLE